ncbi:hypothetical protein CUMW_118580 [Citrus unshiu]|nr:hypothetical protein CUMW_118580 [Citrus unshiu]
MDWMTDAPGGGSGVGPKIEEVSRAALSLLAFDLFIRAKLPCGLRMVVLFRPPLPFIVRIEDRLQFLFPSIVRKIDVWDQVL